MWRMGCEFWYSLAEIMLFALITGEALLHFLYAIASVAAFIASAVCYRHCCGSFGGGSELLLGSQVFATFFADYVLATHICSL